MHMWENHMCSLHCCADSSAHNRVSGAYLDSELILLLAAAAVQLLQHPPRLLLLALPLGTGGGAPRACLMTVC